jgi:hypothetical protein
MVILFMKVRLMNNVAIVNMSLYNTPAQNVYIQPSVAIISVRPNGPQQITILESMEPVITTKLNLLLK